MNSFGLDSAFAWILQTTWQASLLVLLVMLLQRLTRDRLTPQARHALWLVVILRLVMPALPDAPTGLLAPTAKLPVRLVEVWKPSRNSPATVEPTVAFGDRTRAAWSWNSMDLKSLPSSPQPDYRDTSDFSQEAVEPVKSGVASSSILSRHDAWLTVAWSMLALVWLAGCLVLFARGAWRWHALGRRLRLESHVIDPRLHALMPSCHQQMRLRRPVRLAVTSAVATPAVMGVLRPTILLPPRVAAELSTVELRLVLLHELAHLRRGDVLLGWLTESLRTIHWFNPLLRMAFTRMRQLRELACDQAVVRHIGHAQARDYGRTILHVLELLGEVSPQAHHAPVGVTGMAFWFGKDTDSIDERIRMLAQSSPLPRRCSAMLAAALFMSLAAVGLTDGGEPSPAPPTAVTEARAAKDNEDGLVTRVYEAKDVYQGLKLNNDKSHREYVAQWLKAATSPQGRGSYRWLDGHLIVKQTPEVHKRFASALKYVREIGGEPIAIEVTLLTAPEEVVQAIPADWALQPVQSESIARHAKANRLPTAIGSLPAEAHTTTRKELPVMLDVVDDDEAARLMDRFQQHPRANVLSRPKVMTLNGQSATVETSVQRPFVVGLHAGEPQIRVIDEGTVMRLCPLMVDADTAWLDCELELPQVTSVETAEVRARDGKPVTLQIPEVQTTRLRTSISLPLNKTLLLGGVKARKDADGWHSLVVLIRARKGDEANQANNNSHAEHANTDNAAHPKEWTEIAKKRAAGKQEPQILPSPPVPTTDSPTFTTVPPKPNQAASGRPMHGVGVKSDAGVSGSVVIEEDNFQKASHALVHTKTYAVADLVVPIPGFHLNPRAKGNSAQSEIQPVPADFESLTDLITSTIAPDSWEASGGEGSIKPFEANLSLVVSHTESVHNQVADLLKQLRKLQDIQVVVELRLLVLDGGLKLDQGATMQFDSLVLDRQGGDKALKSLLDRSQAVWMPKITLFNHQAAEVSTAHGVRDPDPNGLIRLRVQPVISSDRRSVRLKLSLLGSNEAQLPLATDAPPLAIRNRNAAAADVDQDAKAVVMAQVADGGAILWDLSDKVAGHGRGRLLLAATPRIIVREEGEERIEPKLNFGGVSPRIIEQAAEPPLTPKVDYSRLTPGPILIQEEE